LRSQCWRSSEFSQAWRLLAWSKRNTIRYSLSSSPPYQHLFLSFARLADDGGLDDELNTDRNAQVALDWAHSFGVLGLTFDKRTGQGDPRGGSADTVSAFAFEAWTANKTLRLYEAATRGSGVDVETIAAIAPRKYRGIVAATPAAAREGALDQAANSVQFRVARHCYPQLYGRLSRTWVEGYGFANLLGAMWLQMFWLLVTDDVRRCRACNRMIAYEQPEKPLAQNRGERKRYKTRIDKRFCDGTCRQRYRRARLQQS
jgi:hypothetical protein